MEAHVDEKRIARDGWPYTRLEFIEHYGRDWRAHWVGAHSQPCVSDVHDCVFVLGHLEVEHESPPSDVPDARAENLQSASLPHARLGQLSQTGTKRDAARARA